MSWEMSWGIWSETAQGWVSKNLSYDTAARYAAQFNLNEGVSKRYVPKRVDLIPPTDASTKVTTAPQGTGGKKFDTGKARWDLLPMKAVAEVIKVMTFGASKYGSNNWQSLDQPESRYYAAAMRHLHAWRAGEKTDSESGLPHLAHAACCLVFMLSREVGFDPLLDDKPSG